MVEAIGNLLSLSALATGDLSLHNPARARVDKTGYLHGGTTHKSLEKMATKQGVISMMKGAYVLYGLFL